MTPTIFDIETTAIDNFRTLEGLTAIHCIVIRQGDEVQTYHGDSLERAADVLHQAELIVGHNAIGFDVPVLRRMFPGWYSQGTIRDTKVMARLARPNQKELDYKSNDFPRNLVGLHSLKAWGYRLGEYKGDFNEQEGAWDTFTEEMLKYCVQDTLVTQKLYNTVSVELKDCELAVAIEHMFASILHEQEITGFCFNLLRASEFYAEWSGVRQELRDRLVGEFPPVSQEMKKAEWWSGGFEKYPTKAAAKRAGHKERDIVRGPNKIKETPFNPDSRQQIARCLTDKYGWKPETFTPSGQPQVDDSILKAMPFSEAKLLVDYLTISKRIAQLAEGNEAWLKLEEGGRIFGRVNTNGTVTGRCTHSKPNVAQVPAIYAPYGKECRSLFRASEDMSLVGVDASGLELRCLAHYLSKWDDGLYIKTILEGDIHTANQKHAGLDTRDQAKTFIYALIYGAGPHKIGAIVNGGAKEGKQLMSRFMRKMPAIKCLRESISSSLEKRPHLYGLDGRPIPIRSKHSALNALLQSAGAVLMKQATIVAYDAHMKNNLLVRQVAHVHDEIQFEAAPFHAEDVGSLAVKAIELSGNPFGFKCPLSGEYKVGSDWSETH
jgi:DNA polymerase-1